MTKNQQIYYPILGWCENIFEAVSNLLKFQGIFPSIQGDSSRKPDPEWSIAKSWDETSQGKHSLGQCQIIYHAIVLWLVNNNKELTWK